MNMKRILSVTAALLLLLLALSGCGGGAEEAAEPAEPETETTETVETVASDVSLQELADRMIADAGITDAIPVAQDALVKVYGLDAGQIVEAVGYNASSGGAFPQEIILVRAADADAAAAVSDAFTARLNDIKAQAESYDPDSATLAEQCQPLLKGNCVGLFFSPEFGQLMQIFDGAIS